MQIFYLQMSLSSAITINEILKNHLWMYFSFQQLIFFANVLLPENGEFSIEMYNLQKTFGSKPYFWVDVTHYHAKTCIKYSYNGNKYQFKNEDFLH